jgi:uncharacterized protein (TIRG00374 family)
MGLRQRVPVGTVVRYLLAAAALLWVLAIINWEQTILLLWSMPATTALGILVISLLGFVPRVWMWTALFDHFDGAAFGDALRADLTVKFVNSLFPSRFSGRSIAPLAFRHFTGASWADATAVTGAHTALYAVCYGLISLIGLVVLAPRLPTGVLLIVVLSTGAYVVIATLVILGGWHVDRLEPLFIWLGTKLGGLPVLGDRLASITVRAQSVVGESAISFRTILADRRVVRGYGVSWVLALAVLPGLRMYLLLVGLGTTPPAPWLLPIYLITAYAVTILPLTPGGIGVAEATSTLVFIALGYPEAVVVPAVVLDRFLGIYLPALAGWYPTATADLGEHIPGSE